MESKISVQSRVCLKCGRLIDPERITALPNTQTCADCSIEPKRVGYMVFGHKTGGELVTISPEETELIRQANRANKRSR